ncbi:hypothetical protein GX441_10450 [bacterium]|nr:hypothetical protein [bacterium]
MPLPYGPIMRGLSVSWCYDRVQEGLSSLQNPFQALVFAPGARVVGREKLDKRSVTLSQSPTAVLHVTGVALSNALTCGAPEVIYKSGDENITIVHPVPPGGTEDVRIESSPRHSGNNKYALEITQTGIIGNETTPGAYTLKKTPWTGSEWGVQTTVSSGNIPLSGMIEIGNGSMFEFLTQGSDVVEGDSYSWETEAYRVTNRTVRDAAVTIKATINAQTEEEAAGEGGYLDQLMLMFHRKEIAAELYSDRYETVTEEMTSMSVTTEVEGETVTYMIPIVIKYTGKVFIADVSPLLTRFVLDEPEMP